MIYLMKDATKNYLAGERKQLSIYLVHLKAIIVKSSDYINVAKYALIAKDLKMVVRALIHK